MIIGFPEVVMDEQVYELAKLGKALAPDQRARLIDILLESLHSDSPAGERSPIQTRERLAELASLQKVLGFKQTLGWKQGDSKTIRREEVVIGPHAGPLNVRGDQFEAALLVGDRIHAFHWFDCEGTCGQNLVRIVAGGSQTAVRDFLKSVDSALGENETLAAHFSGILSILATGTYALTLEEIPADSYVVELDNEPVDNQIVGGFYPGFGAMIATQPLSRLSALHVDRLSEKILHGARPTVITLSANGAWCEFIIDGHHKISAYRRTNVPIVRLDIVKLDSERLPLPDVLTFVPDVYGYRQNLAKNRPA
jgi:hypothetical protein